ncbi:hypothetical protein Pint_04126 [Pistacia integerrima]|uniref:Uncharacterized protein n=1 Tax=Pistacia integerrima TaxID=434235 RepID=A0ACC0ZAI8_9ROSI|nr:hypothetical protein Pint_04126 [Pistacia integerrima]
MNNNIQMLPDHLVCPKLETLLLSRQYYYKRRDNIDVSNHFFEEMKALKNVSLSYVDLSLKSLKFLIDLKTLELIHCNLRDISSLKHLAKIEILSLGFSLFDEFPKELGALTELRLLDLRDCRRLKRIPSNVIPRFSQLEELYVGDYFGEREDDETSTEGSNASLSELNSLSSLFVLFLEINGKCLLKDLGSICNKLRRYDISVNTCTEFFYVSESRKRALTVKDIEAALLITFKSLYHTLEYLCLKGVTGCDSILPSIDKGGLNKLISLVLEDCEDVKCIIDTTQLHVPARAFSDLVKLSLRRLNLLREICCGPYEKLQSLSLENLETVDVAECPVHFARVLVQLEEFTVENAPQLKQVFYLDNGSEENVVAGDGKETVVIRLPKLKVLRLGGLASMISFCPENFHSSWPALEDFTIDKCSMSFVTEVVSKVRDLQENLRILRIGSSNQLYDIVLSGLKDGFFKNLEELTPRLQKLKEIFVYDNSELEEVFGDKDVADIMDHKEIVLPQLDDLYLEELPSLSKFCPVGYHFIFPSLSDIMALLVIKGCPKMSTRFSMGEERCVHAKAEALKMGNQDQISEFPSEPSMEIHCVGFLEIKESPPSRITDFVNSTKRDSEKDEQSINLEEEEINTET